MIQERHVKQAKRLDNGELVVGYYLKYLNDHFVVTHDNICWEPNEYTDIKTMTWCCFPSDLCRVDPATVKDVSAKLVDKYYCPNCGKSAFRRNYCEHCGQCIDWSEDGGV